MNQFEIEFTAEGVDACQLDLNGISKPKGSTTPAAFDDMFAFVVVVGVVEEGVEMKQTFHEVDLKLQKKIRPHRGSGRDKTSTSRLFGLPAGSFAGAFG